jgi:hypothetical protein
MSRHEDVFIYINITKSYTCELIKDMKISVNHDGSWRRINKDLATMNHTSKKSKRGLGVEIPEMMEKGKCMFESEVSN